MPIYEFACESCGRVVERLQKLTDPPPDACPQCGAKMVKIMSRNSFQLKGGGWYKDLYSSAQGGGAKEPGGAGESSGGNGASAAGAAASPSAEKSGTPAASPAAPAASNAGAKSSASGSTAGSGKSDA